MRAGTRRAAAWSLDLLRTTSRNGAAPQTVQPTCLAYLIFLEEALGPEWVERWARDRGKLDALREWRKVVRRPPSESQTTKRKKGQSALD